MEEKLKSWFETILPDYSKEKVYLSDIRKVAQWYNSLKALGLLVKEEPAGSEKKSDTTEKSEKTTTSAVKKKKKAPAKPKTEK